MFQWWSTRPATFCTARASPASPAPAFEPPVHGDRTSGVPSRDISTGYYQHESTGHCLPKRRRPVIDSEYRSTPTVTAAFVQDRLAFTTGQLPAQIIAADLTGIGWDRRWWSATLETARSPVFFAKTFIRPHQPPRRSNRTFPRSTSAGDPIRRSGRLRRPGGRHNGKRQARPRGHQRLDRPGERPAQPGQ